MNSLQETQREMVMELFDRDINVCREQKICVACGKDASVFQDKLSETEYLISCLCQECQDKVWKGRDSD